MTAARGARGNLLGATATGGCAGANKQMGPLIGLQAPTILSCGPIAPLVGRRARIVAARLDTYRPSPCPPARVDGRCFSRPRPQGFYSTSGACSVSPFTTMARRQPEVASSAFSSSPPPERPSAEPRGRPPRLVPEQVSIAHGRSLFAAAGSGLESASNSDSLQILARAVPH
jgi:hypothetical protein